jgi:hypothetical protein
VELNVENVDKVLDSVRPYLIAGMCSLTTECVLLLQNVFSCVHTCINVDKVLDAVRPYLIAGIKNTNVCVCVCVCVCVFVCVCV